MIRTVRLADLLCLALLAALCAPASGQGEFPPDLRVDYAFDSGWVRNEGTEPETVISFPVAYHPGTSLRLFFDDVRLSGNVAAGDASILRITGLTDGAVQTMNLEHVRQWQYTSAYFNGDAVQVEVVAQPGTGPNRVVLSQLDVGVPTAPKTICGPIDDRVLSSDPRVARLMPVACTTWLIDDCAKCFLSAGHCVGFIDTVQFNVPLSNGNGSFNHPGPEDQYPVDPASVQSNGGQGTGNDWAYFGTFANSNTGLTAAEAQGSVFELVAPPPVAGTTIRITGNGSDSTPSTHNHVQQTHAGPMVTSTASLVQYQADTTGGNSGSPVIWDQTDQAVGIHTHGGCGSTGGANSGTSSTQSGLQAALASPQGICLTGANNPLIVDMGGGLTNFPIFVVPALTACGTLDPDSVLTLTLEAPALPLSTVTSTLVVGFSAVNVPFHGGTLVPFPNILIPGLVAVDGLIAIPIPWPAGIPSGLQLYFQHWMILDTLTVDVELASNGLEVTAP